jgi:hypothetical protein
MHYLFTSLVLIILCASVRAYHQPEPSPKRSAVRAAAWIEQAPALAEIEYAQLFAADLQPEASVLDTLTALLQRHDVRAELLLALPSAEQSDAEFQLYRAEQLRSSLELRGVDLRFLRVFVSSEPLASGAEGRLRLYHTRPRI